MAPHTRSKTMATKFIAFDTETTGLPTTRSAPTIDNLSNFDKCRMISVACVEFDADFKVIGKYHKIVKPDDFKVDATEIHGITEEMAQTQGIPFVDIWAELTCMFHLCPTIVGHNVKFDFNVLKSEAIRRNLDTTAIDNADFICTLDLTKQIFLKPMKLGILYKQLFGKELDGAHDALNDSVAAGEVYGALLNDPRTYEEKPLKRVIIKASDVAACIRKHPYKKPDQVLDDMWSKYMPSTFKGQTMYQKELGTIKNTGTQSMFDAIDTSSLNSSEELKNYREVFHKKIDSLDISDDEKDTLKNHSRMVINTSYGTKAEDSTANLDASELFTDDTFYKFKICEIQGTVYEIVGRIDRYEKNDDGSRTIVEIKNRTNKLFGSLKKYEWIQVQTYLEMCDSKWGRLVEQFGPELKSYMVERDSDFWNNTAVPRLREFCKTFHHYI